LEARGFLHGSPKRRNHLGRFGFGANSRRRVAPIFGVRVAVVVGDPEHAHAARG
jgi:hypothetical protein